MLLCLALAPCAADAQEQEVIGQEQLGGRKALVGKGCVVNQFATNVQLLSGISGLENLVDEDLDNFATFTTGVPRWRKDSGLGWVTAEYAMLPRATAERTDRESVRGKIGGRTHEISRLIGRCLRGVVDMKALGENQIQLDCDVLQADGGTRTASITGAYVALVDALRWAERNRKIRSADKVLKDCVSAVSVGVINGTPMLDLPYIEDSQAMTDMNVAMTGSGQFIEIQGTAEHRPFSREELNRLLDLAEKGNKELQAAQRAALAE